jgi:hypothetical protein
MNTPLDQIAKAAFEKLAADAQRECDQLLSRVGELNLSAHELVALSKVAGQRDPHEVAALNSHLSDATQAIYSDTGTQRTHWLLGRR